MDREQFADFLRSRRARVRPQDVGLPPGASRRTPGLRRQEVAQLAGISVDYYIRLEQGRGPHPSTQVLEALARALRLGGDERAHLFHLSGSAPLPGASPRRDVPAGILHLLDRLDDAPAIVVDATYQLLAWNPMWAALIGSDPASLPPEERNALHSFFSEDAAECPGQLAQEAVADLRAAAARYPADTELQRLIGELSAGSALFRELWVRHEVQVRRSTTKHVRHPVVGDIQLDVETLQIPDRDQRLLFFTAAPGSPSQRALELLKVVGLQELADHR